MRRRRYAKSKRVFKILRKTAQLDVTKVMGSAFRVTTLGSRIARTAVQQKANLDLALRDATLAGRPRPAAPFRTTLRFLPRVRRKKARQVRRVRTALGVTSRTLR